MRRADRLFQIIQILRRTRRPVTADVIALEVETSKRTIYRDIADLMGQRVPIRGEAGVGYVLDGGFDLPPLMLTADEIEAAVLGAKWVAGHGDPALAKAAQDLMAKISVAVPEQLRPIVLDPAVGTPPSRAAAPARDGLDMAQVRAWIHAGRKISIDYQDELGRPTERVIWPVAVGYMETKRLLIGWCELRVDFRNFRADRVVGATFLDERYNERPSVLRARWRRSMAERAGDCPIAKGQAPSYVWGPDSTEERPAMPTRTANAEWNGDLKSGAGHMRLGSGAFDGAYDFRSRMGDGAGTNPEELIGAAHAGCFSMALAAQLGGAGFTPESIKTGAKVHFGQVEGGFAIEKIELDTEAKIAGIDDAAFQQQAETAKKNCPVSKALAGVEIVLTARLAS